MNKTAEAIRRITSIMQNELESGRRAGMIDAYDLVDLLLAIADDIDPPFGKKTKKTKLTKHQGA